MKSALLLVMVCAFRLQGQLVVNPYRFTVTATYSPTNIAGITNLSWWIADGQALTNSTGFLSNWLDSGVSPRNLTNLGASSNWPLVSNNIVNGHAMVRYPYAANTILLRSANYTSTQPHTVVMAVRWWQGDVSGTRYYYGSAVATGEHLLQNSSGRKIDSGTSVAVGVITTNKWQVIEVIHNNTASGFFTNNISAGTFSSGTEVQNGFTLGNNSGGNSVGFIDVAEVLTYSGTLGAIDSAGTFSVAANRVAVYNYLTNKYQITQ